MNTANTLPLKNGGNLHIVLESDDVIVSVQFSGDLSFIPHEAQIHLEQLLRYHPFDKDLLTYMIEAFLKQDAVQLSGATVDELVTSILLCHQKQ